MPTRKVPEADEDGRLGTMPQGATIFAITAIGFFFFPPYLFRTFKEVWLPKIPEKSPGKPVLNMVGRADILQRFYQYSSIAEQFSTQLEFSSSKVSCRLFKKSVLKPVKNRTFWGDFFFYNGGP